MIKYGYNLDEISYQMGFIGCFSEMVAAKLKKIALSKPAKIENVKAIEKSADYLTKSYDIYYYVDYDMVKNNIISDEELKDRAIFVLYEKKEYLDEYMALKKKQEEAISNGTYTDNTKKETTLKLCELLCYSKEMVKQKYL